MKFLKDFFKKQESKKVLSHRQIAAFETLRIKRSIESNSNDLLLLEPKNNIGIPEYLVLSFKGKTVATLYGDTFVTKSLNLSKPDREKINKILGDIKQHYE